jgi:hypothetical protein
MTPRVRPSAPLPPRAESASEEAEVRHFVESGELRLPVPGAIAEHPAVSAALQRWQKEEAARLADAEIAWTGRSDKRLNIARIAAQRAESALEQVQRQLDRAHTNLVARETELSQLLSLHQEERERWNQSPAAAQKQQAERDLQFERRMKIALRLARDLAVTVCVIAASVVVGDRATPIVANMLRQETGERSHIGPLLQKAGVPFPITDTAPQALITARVVRLRAEPDPGAVVTGRLWRNEAVVPIVSSGTWVLVRIGAAPHEQRGWLPATALKPVIAPLSAAR